MSLFSGLALAPRDPVLGIKEAYLADPRPDKVNLGVGVYLDESGAIPLLGCVREAEARLADNPAPWDYLPIDGLPAYTAAVKGLVFGAGSALVDRGRVVTVQGLGGTGGLRIGAGLLRLASPAARVLISAPSWENHEAVFTRAGFAVGHYAYYGKARQGVDVGAMVADLAAAEPGTIVVLHACCHNPTGYDLAPADWRRVLDVVQERNLTPFLDMAYQGFGQGVEQDAAAVRLFADAGLCFLVATSFSKSFSLYGERVGALSVVAASAKEAARVLSQAKVVIRTLYSNPPTHGAALVATVLSDAELRARWDDELRAMRERIASMRVALRAGLEEAGLPKDFSFITRQVGMFSYCGLAKAQMERLRRDFGVYGLDSGRLCMAGLNDANLGAVVEAIARVVTT